jgi:hypothetical protein
MGEHDVPDGKIPRQQPIRVPHTPLTGGSEKYLAHHHVVS